MAAEITGWLTRQAVVRRLGITTSRLRELERAGDLKPARDVHGRFRFDPGIVDRLARATVTPRSSGGRRRGLSGPEAARIFRLFGEGRALREIVLDCEQTPEVVLSLRRQYADMGRDLLVSPAQVTELRELLDWQGDDDRSLVGAVSRRLRHQFERGQALGREDPDRNHNEKEVSSGNQQ